MTPPPTLANTEPMAIGVFDSGVGGLTVHHKLVERFPQADFVYLADQANTPYGGRPGEEIVALTRAGCERLFAEGCSVVVLACNTAASVALRRLQQTWLPGFRRELGRPVNVIGIVVPTIEAATGLPWEHEAERRGDKVEKLDILGVFSTPATAASRVYEIEVDKRRQDVAVFSEPCPELARMIEQNAPRDELKAVVAGHVQALKSRIGRSPDRAILGCTHYEIVADLFGEALPPGTPVIHQPEATADAMARYFERHPEYETGQGGTRRFLTTGAPGAQNGLVETFWGAPLHFEKA
jgi:glutamate racemase